MPEEHEGLVRNQESGPNKVQLNQVRSGEAAPKIIAQRPVVPLTFDHNVEPTETPCS